MAEGGAVSIELPPVAAKSPRDVADERSPIRAVHAEQGNFDLAIHTGTGDEAETDAARAPPRQQRAFRFPWYRAACAVLMLAVGVACGISGAAVLSLALGVVSILLTLPGAYMTWVYFQVYRNNPRYTNDRFLGLEPLD